MHKPVLLNEVLTLLNPASGESYLDLTAGYGGHASEILKITKAPHETVLIDRDEEATAELKARFGKEGAEVIHSDFTQAALMLKDQGRQFDIILADLGVSSPHLDNASRGFSFMSNGPLDMRMDQTQELTAFMVVNNWSKEKLTQILREYGNEPNAGKIAGSIIAHRPIKTTADLAGLIERITPRHGKIHPATRSFQAIRVAVNNELELLKKALPVWVELLATSGRIAIISFHSLEDRIVKEQLKYFSDGRYSAQIKLLTKKPVAAARNEIVYNPRARSAKLRAAVKIKTLGA